MKKVIFIICAGVGAVIMAVTVLERVGAAISNDRDSSLKGRGRHILCSCRACADTLFRRKKSTYDAHIADNETCVK